MNLRVVIAAILASSAFGCGGSSTQPSSTQPSWDGRVRVAGIVQDFTTNTAVSAATVVFGDPGAGDMTATTDISGGYSLTALPGVYHVTINGESIADVTLRDPSYRGDFFIRLTHCVGRYGMVLDSRTRQPVSGATLRLTGSVYATTDRTGWFQEGMGRTCLPPPSPTLVCGAFNTYFLTISHPAYADRTLESSRGFCSVRRSDVELQPR